MLTDVPIADLQAFIIVVALIMGAIRGALGYWLTAPNGEKRSWNKFGKTVVRYAIFNLASINLIAAIGGIVWTASSVTIYTIMIVALDLGYDLNKGKTTSAPTPL